MTRFIIVVCFLAVQLNCGLSATTVTYSDKKPTAQLTISDKKATECILVSNKGTKHNYNPSLNNFNTSTRIRGQSLDSCSVEITQANKNDIGLWTITQYGKDGNSAVYEFNIYYEKYGTISPTDTILVYQEHYAIAKIADDIENIVRCEVITPKKNRFDILKENITNIEKFDTCGVRIMVATEYSNEYNGKWHLLALKKNKEVISAQFTLDIRYNKKLITAQQNVSLKAGAEGNIELTNIESTYCQLTDSHGVQLPLRTGHCQHNIEVVTPYHAGLWKARYGVQGRLDTIEVDIMVTTYDPDVVITSVVPTQNYDEVNMMCRLPVAEHLRVCLFISPNGSMVHISSGIGIKKYEFYGEVEKGICGITIHNPDDNDYGIWRCLLSKINYSDKQEYSSFLHLNRDNENKTSAGNYSVLPTNDIHIFGDDVSVKRNDSFTIKCGADAVLHYCWLRSPTGITYSVTTDEQLVSSKTLLYTGPGLEEGVCEAIIPNAMYEHAGTWNCYMGSKNYPEVEKSISVNVEDDYIIAEEATVTHNGEASRNLSCHLFPHLQKTIEYCRWIRPDGRGIYVGASSRYVSEMYDGRCGLTIIGNELRNEDTGLWTCIAGLSGRATMEVAATININKPSMPIATLASIIIGSCAVLGIVAVVLVLINVRRRRRVLLPPNNPPPYDAEQIQGIPPKSMTQAQGEMKYDQKHWNDSRTLS